MTGRSLTPAREHSTRLLVPVCLDVDALRRDLADDGQVLAA